MIFMGFIQLERFYDSVIEKVIIVMIIALVQEQSEKKILFSIELISPLYIYIQINTFFIIILEF